MKQTALNGQGPHVDGPNDEASGEGDMLWQCDTMALPFPAELADEDYEELMLVIEQDITQSRTMTPHNNLSKKTKIPVSLSHTFDIQNLSTL